MTDHAALIDSAEQIQADKAEKDAAAFRQLVAEVFGGSTTPSKVATALTKCGRNTADLRAALAKLEELRGRVALAATLPDAEADAAAALAKVSEAKAKLQAEEKRLSLALFDAKRDAGRAVDARSRAVDAWRKVEALLSPDQVERLRAAGAKVSRATQDWREARRGKAPGQPEGLALARLQITQGRNALDALATRLASAEPAERAGAERTRDQILAEIEEAEAQFESCEVFTAAKAAAKAADAELRRVRDEVVREVAETPELSLTGL